MNDTNAEMKKPKKKKLGRKEEIENLYRQLSEDPYNTALTARLYKLQPPHGIY